MNTFSKTTRKNISACVMAPFSVFPAILVLYLSLFVYAEIANSAVSTTGIEVGILMAFVGWIMALLLTVIYGLPVALILQKFNKFKLHNLVTLSLVPTFITSVATNAEYGVLFMYAYCSTIVAVTYWYIFNKRPYRL